MGVPLELAEQQLWFHSSFCPLSTGGEHQNHELPLHQHFFLENFQSARAQKFNFSTTLIAERTIWNMCDILLFNDMTLILMCETSVTRRTHAAKIHLHKVFTCTEFSHVTKVCGKHETEKLVSSETSCKQNSNHRRKPTASNTMLPIHGTTQQSTQSIDRSTTDPSIEHDFYSTQQKLTILVSDKTNRCWNFLHAFHACKETKNNRPWRNTVLLICTDVPMMMILLHPNQRFMILPRILRFKIWSTSDCLSPRPPVPLPIHLRLVSVWEVLPVAF